MKKFTLAICLLSSTAMAYEVKDNPDRFPSVGVNYTGVFLKGEGTFEPVPGFFFNKETDLKDTLHQTVVDLRLPAMSNLTFNFGAGYASRTVDRIDASLFQSGGALLVVGDRLTDDYSGPVVNAGVRYYFH